jgi:hypothetical protein
MAASSSCTIEVHHNAIAIVAIRGSPNLDDWHTFERDYRRLYVTLPQFAVLFDLRDVGLSISLGIMFLRAKEMIFSLKAHSTRQLIAAIVLTNLPELSQKITDMVRASGQAALFYAYSDPDLAAATAACLAAAIQRKWVHGPQPYPFSVSKLPNALVTTSFSDGLSCFPRPSAVSWNQLRRPFLVFFLGILFLFMRGHRHFLQPEAVFSQLGDGLPVTFPPIMSTASQ